MFVCFYPDDIFSLLLKKEEGRGDLEGGEGEEKERERNIDVRKKHPLVAFWMSPDWKPNPQTRHVP